VAAGSAADDGDGGLGLAEPAYTYEWLCDDPDCGRPFDRVAVEAGLVAIVETRSMGYQTQDLYCVKCKRTRASALRAYCECSGRYVNGESPARLDASMRVFGSIARRYGLTWLAETVDWVSQARSS
jgi:DNA polymerase epsilon subunit 1